MNISELYKIFLQYPKICIDSRKAEVGSLFFALKGKNFNGNKFAEEALEKCQYAVVDEKEYAKSKQYILVKDALGTLQGLAAYHRKRLGLPIIGITGTNGKTTTKELIMATMRKRYKVAGTIANFNNHIGVPLTLLSMTKEDKFGVVEMGANHIGEIALLCKIAAPDFGIITNIGRAHLEGFGSIEGVKTAKSEMYTYLAENNGLAFINDDNEMLEDLNPPSDIILYGQRGFTHCQGKILNSEVFLKFSWYASNNLGEENENVDWKNEKRIVQTKLVGKYNFENALAAVCIANNFGVSEKDIKDALENYEPKNNRSQIIKTKENTILADSYNANPASMKIAIENLIQTNLENKTLILGDMFELGKSTDREHANIIYMLEYMIKKEYFDTLFLVGESFFKYQHEISKNMYFFKNTNDLIYYLKNNKLKNKNILLKGSRGVGLEKLIPYL